MLLKFKVGEKHIENGRRRDCRNCPVSLALIDVLSEKLGEEVVRKNFVIQVSRHVIYISYVMTDGDGEELCIRCLGCSDVPPFVTRFITDFDRLEEVKGFDAELEFKDFYTRIKNDPIDTFFNGM